VGEQKHCKYVPIKLAYLQAVSPTGVAIKLPHAYGDEKRSLANARDQLPIKNKPVIRNSKDLVVQVYF